MKLLEKILVPIDINIDSKEQLKTAVKIAKLCNSEIYILYVVPNEELKAAVKEIVIKTAKEALNKIKDIFISEGVKVNEPEIEYGKPVNNILKIANRENINLMLIGSGNKDKKEKFKRGSTAARLMRQSEKPVWVVKSDKENRFKNILCPIDFSDLSKYALSNAVLLSKFLNTDLTILGVFEQFTNFSPRVKVDIDKENKKRFKQFEKKINSFVKEFDLNGVNYTIAIKSGFPHTEILKAIKDNKHDLLVMGTHGRSGINKFVMGSVTEKVTREVPCSFITTKTEDVFQLKYNNEIKEIQLHYKKGNDMFKNKSYKDAIGQYIICLQINKMHIPSMFKLAEVFTITEEHSKAKEYSNMAKDILDRLWDKEIGQEVVNYYAPEN